MSKIYTFDEALEYVEKYNEADDAGYHDTSPPDGLDFYVDDDYEEYGDMSESELRDLSNMMRNFEEFMSGVYDELTHIINNEKDRMDEVVLDFDVYDERNGLTQVYVVGTYEDFTYDRILVVPTVDWRRDKETIRKWVKAFVIREYKRYNGEL